MHKSVIPMHEVNRFLSLTSEFCGPSFTLGDCSETCSGRKHSVQVITVVGLAKQKQQRECKEPTESEKGKQTRLTRLLFLFIGPLSLSLLKQIW